MALQDDAPMSAEWNYHPDIPLDNASIFRWPPDPKQLADWFRSRWLMFSERVMMVFLAIFMWVFVYPSLDRAQAFAVGWIFQTWIANLVLVGGVAGGLHWYFYVRRAQGKRLKFDRREQAKGSRLWNFSSQVRDNMFWSLTSGVALLTAFQVLVMWAMANGFAPTITFAENPIWFLLALVLVPVWSAFHFYWIHRLLHVPFLYKRVHALHHRNVNVGPWSGMAMHPVEHLLYLSTLLIHFVVPTHPIHLYFHVIYEGPGAAMTHTGYENLLVKDKRRLALGTFYHQLHHRYYECNYGNEEMPWDRWFGTFHDGSEDATRATRDRKKRMYSA